MQPIRLSVNLTNVGCGIILTIDGAQNIRLDWKNQNRFCCSCPTWVHSLDLHKARNFLTSLVRGYPKTAKPRRKTWKTAVRIEIYQNTATVVTNVLDNVILILPVRIPIYLDNAFAIFWVKIRQDASFQAQMFRKRAWSRISTAFRKLRKSLSLRKPQYCRLK